MNKTSCFDCPLRMLASFRPFEGDELEFVSAFKQGEITLRPGTDLVLEETSSPHLYTVLGGWCFRYKTLPDGRRQILNYALPGDFLGLQSSLFDRMQHGIEALTDVTLCVFPRDGLWTLFERYPSLGYDVTWLASNEERHLDAHLTSVGRRSAFERIAFLLWTLFARARLSGLVAGSRLDFPLTQQHVADTLGLSIVHVNKTLKKLRATGSLEWENHCLNVLDEDLLKEQAVIEETLPHSRPFV